MATRNPLGNLGIEELIAAGQAAYEDSRLEDAINHFTAALQVKPLSAEDEAIIRCQLSEALERRDLRDEFIEEISKYDNPTELTKLSEHTKMRVLIRLGWNRFYKYDTPGAIALFNQAMRMARNLDDHVGIGECHFGLGNVYRRFSELAIARDHYSSAIEWLRRSGSWRRLAESYSSICSIALREGDYRNAMDSYKQALAIIGEHREHYLFSNWVWFPKIGRGVTRSGAITKKGIPFSL